MGESISPGTRLLWGGDPSPTSPCPHHLRADAGRQPRPAPPHHPAGCCRVAGAAGRGSGGGNGPWASITPTQPCPPHRHPGGLSITETGGSRTRGQLGGAEETERSAGRGEEWPRAWPRGCSTSGQAPRLPCTSWAWLQAGPASFSCSLGRHRSGGLSVSSPEVTLPLIGHLVVRLLCWVPALHLR